MFIFPDPLPALGGKPGTFRERERIQWKDRVNKIKGLYFDHKFKHCAALCDDFLSHEQVRILINNREHYRQARPTRSTRHPFTSTPQSATNRLVFLLTSTPPTSCPSSTRLETISSRLLQHCLSHFRQQRLAHMIVLTSRLKSSTSLRLHPQDTIRYRLHHCSSLISQKKILKLA